MGSAGRGRAWGAAARLLVVAAALLFVAPVLEGLGRLGVSDWDWSYFFHAVPARTIGEYWQAPLWNPWYCGGSPMLASPQSTFLSPLFVFVLAFGEVAGTKLIIAACAVTGMLGMYSLARASGLARASSFLPPVVFMMSSWYALRVGEGHTVFLPFAFLPFVASFYLRSLDRGRALRHVILSAAFLVLIFLAGGAYPFSISVVFLGLFSLFSAISRRSLRPLLCLALVGVVAALLGAVKVLPSYEFMSDFPRKTEDRQYHSAGILKDSLLSRNQHVMEQDESFYMGPEQTQAEYLKGFYGGERPWGWHEYGAFVGFGALALYAAGLALMRRSWHWPVISIIALLLALGQASPIDIWTTLHHLPVFSSLHGPSRLIILFVFALSMTAGYALSRFEQGRFPASPAMRSAVAAAAVIVVLLEIGTVTRPLLKDVFVEQAPLATAGEYTQVVAADPMGTTYDHFLANRGVVNCYESMRPKIAAAPYGDDQGRTNPGYRGEVYLAGGSGSARLKSFSPNSIKAEVDATAHDTLVLNQNFYKGWRVRSDGSRAQAQAHGGLVSTPVGPGLQEVEFYYSPSSYRLGLAVSIFSSVIFGALAFRGGMRRRRP